MGMLKYLLPLATVTVVIIISVLCIFIANTLRDKNSEHKELEKQKTRYLNLSNIFLVMHYYLVLASLICTISVIYFNQSTTDNGKKIGIIALYSVLAIIFTLSDLIVRPEKKAAKYRESYRIVDNLLNGLKYGDKPEIADELRKCEKNIQDGHF